jgi:hypothetical protein
MLVAIADPGRRFQYFNSIDLRLAGASHRFMRLRENLTAYLQKGRSQSICPVLVRAVVRFGSKSLPSPLEANLAAISLCFRPSK